MTRLEKAREQLDIWRERIKIAEAGLHQARLAVLAAEDEEAGATNCCKENSPD